MKTKAKKNRNVKNKGKGKKKGPANLELQKLVAYARDKATGNGSSKGTEAKHGHNFQNRERKKQKTTGENNNGFASPPNDNNNKSNKRREGKPLDTERKRKVMDAVNKGGGVDNFSRVKLLRLFNEHDDEELFRYIGKKNEELEVMCLEDLRTLYTAIYDHLDNKEEGIAYAKKHLAYVNDIGDADADATAAEDDNDNGFEKEEADANKRSRYLVSPKQNRMSAPIVYVSPEKEENSDKDLDLFKKEEKRYGRNRNKKKRNINEGDVSMMNSKKKWKNENNTKATKGKKASENRARNEKGHVLTEKNDVRTSEMKSSKSALALALPSNRNSKQQRSPKGEWNKKKFYRKVKVEDEVFKVGDDVYVCTPETVDFPEDVDHICELCKMPGFEEGADGKAVESEMLECDYCVRSWHLQCLKLDHVPEETFWSCPMCVAAPSGIAAPQNFHERRTPCGEFLAGRLCLARIESIWANVDELNDEDPKVREEAFKFIARLYVLPEHTHTGRQRHHIRREVFLTNTKEE